MSDVGQMTPGPTGNEATIAAMADVLAAIGSTGGLMEWADEDPAAPAPSGQPVPASGATITHGAIRLRDSAPPVLGAEAETVDAETDDAETGDREAGDAEPDPTPRADVGHGPIRLRDRPAEPAAGDDDEPDEAPPEPVGHGAVRIVEPAGPALPDITPIAVADILDALDAVPPA